MYLSLYWPSIFEHKICVVYDIDTYMYYVSCYYFDNVRYILLYRWCIYTICEQARTSYTCYATKQLCDDKTLHVSHKKVMLKYWTHFYIRYPLVLSWTLNISNLELLKHCLWISRLNFKHLRLNIEHYKNGDWKKIFWTENYWIFFLFFH